SDIGCTRTLYNYVDQGLLSIHNYDLPEKLKRNTKIHRVRKNKKKLGRSIEQRPQEVNKRDVFGHWECDLALGHKTKDDEVLLTMSERMSREFLIIKVPDKTAAIDVLHAFYAKWNKSYNHVIRNLKDIEPDLLVFYNYPKQIRASIYSTNMIESFNNVIKRKAKPKAEFPTEQSLDTFIGIQAMSYNERYFN
ncbi:MAG: IS30 family transposase, partial [Lactobacillus gallinarum]